MSRRPAPAAAVWLAVAATMASGCAGSATSSGRGVVSRGAGAAANPSADTVLARVGGEQITPGDLQRRLEELPEPYRANFQTPDGRRQLLDRMIEERVWLLGARRSGVDRRPEVRRQLEQTERDIVIRTYVNEVMAARPAPADSEAQAYYDGHPADYRMPATVTLSHILLTSESQARRVRRWAAAGRDWQRLVTRYSADTVTRATGGSLGTVTRDGNFAALGPQPALAESAFALGTASGEGAIGGPYRSDRGWHVIRVEAVKPETVRPFEQVKPLILRQLGQERSQEYYRERLGAEKESLGVTVDSVAIRSFLFQRKSAQEMFREGQEMSVPTARIAAYRRLLEEYPDSDVSPQAQFMIGFIYSEELKDYDEAERAFGEMLRRYPASELAESARWMIANMRTEDAPAPMDSAPDTTRRSPGARQEGEP